MSLLGFAGPMSQAALVSSTSGQASALVHAAEEGKGLAASRSLVRTYVPDSPDQHVEVLSGLLAPRWSASMTTFEQELADWERAPAEQYQAMGFSLPDQCQTAVLSRWAPGPTRSFLRLQLAATLASFEAIRTVVKSSLARGAVCDAHGAVASQQPVPVELDAKAPCNGLGQGSQAAAASAAATAGKEKCFFSAASSVIGSERRSDLAAGTGGKPQSQQSFSGNCRTCGRPCRKAEDCRSGKGQPRQLGQMDLAGRKARVNAAACCWNWPNSRNPCSFHCRSLRPCERLCRHLDDECS